MVILKKGIIVCFLCIDIAFIDSIDISRHFQQYNGMRDPKREVELTHLYADNYLCQDKRFNKKKRPNYYDGFTLAYQHTRSHQTVHITNSFEIANYTVNAHAFD